MHIQNTKRRKRTNSGQQQTVESRERQRPVMYEPRVRDQTTTTT
jgi:hypothetical protein